MKTEGRRVDGHGGNFNAKARRRQDTTRRSRNRSSAELYSAVSRICNPLRFLPAGRLAECNSAIQQIENLRYEKSSRATTILTDSNAQNTKSAGKQSPLQFIFVFRG